MPDAVFVEDMAVVFDEMAILTGPGAESRRREMPAIAAALAAYRPLQSIQPPATIDGGDVLVAGRRVFVGRSSRTNEPAIAPDAPAARAVRLTGRSDGGARLPAPEVGGDRARRGTAAGEPGVGRSPRRSRGSRSSRSLRTSRRPPTRCGSRIGSSSPRRFRGRPNALPRSACGSSAWRRASSRRPKAR